MMNRVLWVNLTLPALLPILCLLPSPAQADSIVYDLALADKVKNTGPLMSSCHNLIEYSRTKFGPGFGLSRQRPAYLISQKRSSAIHVVFVERSETSADPKVYARRVSTELPAIDLEETSLFPDVEQCAAFLQSEEAWQPKILSPVFVDQSLAEAILTAAELDHASALRVFFQRPESDKDPADFDEEGPGTVSWFLRASFVKDQLVFLYRERHVTLLSAIPPLPSFSPIPTIKIPDRTRRESRTHKDTKEPLTFLQAVKELDEPKIMSFELGFEPVGLARERPEAFLQWMQDVKASLFADPKEGIHQELSRSYEGDKVIFRGTSTFSQILTSRARIELQAPPNGFRFLEDRPSSVYQDASGSTLQIPIQTLKLRSDESFLVPGPVVRKQSCTSNAFAIHEAGDRTLAYDSAQPPLPQTDRADLFFSQLRQIATQRRQSVFDFESDPSRAFGNESLKGRYRIDREERDSLRDAHACLQDLWDRLYLKMYRIQLENEGKHAPGRGKDGRGEGRTTFEILVQAPEFSERRSRELRERFGRQYQSRNRAFYARSFLASQVLRLKQLDSIQGPSAEDPAENEETPIRPSTYPAHPFDIRVRAIREANIDQAKLERFLDRQLGDLFITVTTW